MSGYYDGTEPNSNHIPRVVFVATAQKRMPQAPQTVAKLTFALDVCQEKTAQPAFESSAPRKALNSCPLKKCGGLKKKVWVFF